MNTQMTKVIGDIKLHITNNNYIVTANEYKGEAYLVSQPMEEWLVNWYSLLTKTLHYTWDQSKAVGDWIKSEIKAKVNSKEYKQLYLNQVTAEMLPKMKERLENTKKADLYRHKVGDYESNVIRYKINNTPEKLAIFEDLKAKYKKYRELAVGKEIKEATGYKDGDDRIWKIWARSQGYYN